MVTIQDNDSILIYRVGPVLCCAPCISVLSITHPAPLTKLPGQKSRHSGIFKFGSILVTVCELRKNFGVDPEQWLEPGRIIITELSSGHIGFWVDEIIDVMESPGTGWGTPPPLIPRATFSKTLTLNKQIHLYVEFENLYAIKQIAYLKSYIEHLNKLNLDVEKNNLIELSDNKINTETDITKPQITTEKNSSATIKKLSTPVENIKRDIKPPKNHQKKIILTKEINKSKILTPNIIENKKSLPETPVSLKLDLWNRTNCKSESEHLLHKTIDSKTVVNKNIKPENHTQNIKLNRLENKISDNHEIKINSILNIETSPENLKISALNDNNNIQTRYSYDSSDTGQFSNGIFIGLVLIAFLIGGGFYALYDNPATIKKNISINSKVLPQGIKHNNKIVTNRPLVTTETKSDKNNIEQRKVTVIEKTESNQEIKFQNKKSTDAYDRDKTNYSANITKNSNGITITLHTPITKEKFTSLKSETETINKNTKLDKIDTGNTENNDTNPGLHETEKINKETISYNAREYKIKIVSRQKNSLINIDSSTISKEIIHIVVKGDTLWHIAKFYVDDPYRYPELARLSNITNPDLIYPGDRVHIIQIFTNGTGDSQNE